MGQAVKKTQRGQQKQQTVVFMDEDGAEHHFDDAAASTTARSVAASPADDAAASTTARSVAASPAGPKKKKTQATAKPKLARRRAAPKPFPDLQVDESEDTQPTSAASAMSELAAPQTRKKATTARATAAAGGGGRAAPQKQVLVRRSLRILMKQNPQVKSRFAALTQPPAMWTGTAGSPHLAPSSLPVSHAHTPASLACMHAHTRRRARPARTSGEEGGVE
jgi:hypothetical protein